jgi:hypothetical protein
MVLQFIMLIVHVQLRTPYVLFHADNQKQARTYVCRSWVMLFDRAVPFFSLAILLLSLNERVYMHVGNLKRAGTGACQWNSSSPAALFHLNLLR